MSCLLIIPSVPTVWREKGNKPDSGDREARLKLGKGTVAGGRSPGVKMGASRLGQGLALPLHPQPLTLEFLQWAPLALLDESLFASLSFQYFFSGYICYVIKELAKKKMSPIILAPQDKDT